MPSPDNRPVTPTFIAEDVARTSFFAQLRQWQQDGRLGGAIDHWKHARQKTTSAAEAEFFAKHLKTVASWLNRGGAELFAADCLGDALASFTLALRAQEDYEPAMNNAATCLKELGRLDDSTVLYEQALALKPDFAAAHGNLLMNMHYKSGVTPAMLAAAHREWNEKHAYALQQPFVYTSPAEPDRPLRIGLVSADLGQHPVGIFLVRYLENIDRKNFIFVAYDDGRRRGTLADRLRAAVTEWHDVKDLADHDLAEKIHADHIDILIDLAGHIAENRLGVFARKPAPVQISWLGYPGDTGLSAIDDVIGDPHVLPLTQQPFSRAQIRHLPDCFACFDPPEDAPSPDPLPATAPGEMTFGYFGNPAKCGSDVIGLWADILKQLPKSRLLLKYKGFGETLCRQWFETQFATAGIDPERLEFQGASSLPELFHVMQGVDLALDPFPFAGGLMTCLTLWMGIPVTTWPGETFTSRQGLSFLSAVGMTDLIAASRADYMVKVVALAQDLPRLQSLRQRLRPAMASSTLCDGPRAAAGLQNLLRQIWRDRTA